MCSGGEDGWGGKKEQTIVSVWRVGKINPEGDGGGSLLHRESRGYFESRGIFPLGEAKTILSVWGVLPYGKERPFRGWESFLFIQGRGYSGWRFFLIKGQGLL